MERLRAEFNDIWDGLLVVVDRHPHLILHIENLRQFIDHLLEVLKELRKHGLDVDPVLFPQSRLLQDFYQTEFGEATITEENANIHPQFIPPLPFNYVGDLVDGVPSGKGIITYNDRFRYEGHFLNGRKHGPGVLIIADGSDYTIQEQQYYHGKRYGLFIGFNTAMRTVYCDNYDSNGQMFDISTMWDPERREMTFYQMRNNRIDGRVLILNVDTFESRVENYIQGVLQRARPVPREGNPGYEIHYYPFTSEIEYSNGVPNEIMNFRIRNGPMAFEESNRIENLDPNDPANLLEHVPIFEIRAN